MRPPGWGLAGRLLAAMTVVVLAGGVTAWIVAGAVGPVVFHQHMGEAGMGAGPGVVQHAEEAFQSSSALALAIGLAASVVASLAVSVFLTRRIASSLGTLTSAATSIAAGHLDSRVDRPALGAEFDQLADAFNDMARQLEAGDALRQRLLADVAHEVRTPVAVIGAYLEGLEDGVTTLTPQTVSVLRDQGARLARLAADLAAVTRAEQGTRSLVLAPASPHELLSAALAAARSSYASAGVELTFDVDPGVPAVVVDADRMSQVLGNLLDNAVRHTPRGGSVRLGAHLTEAGLVRLTVADTGEGIDPEHLGLVFERFYRVDTARDRDSGGSGIGLAIVRAIVVAHGGTVTAHSAGAGCGSRFDIDLVPAPGQPA
ncbi:HAMP domain-containing histidine kinase [Cellulomonas humilata]|uniref:histidine kinase n=1 Tax=Cellulomonas humilata TaxID=144055 RepID=A0A7Y5ZWW6_9CELL|nr:HAMP domain-containing sensor histidine kinase [Cellulomonas humilata]NUU15658.1 HAMP domain-containing histidine kinase [Cellulomonas humilata]